MTDTTPLDWDSPPKDWHPPMRTLPDKAWKEHPQRERLAKLIRLRDDDGDPLWTPCWVDDEQLSTDDEPWVAVMLRPVDPRMGQSVLIGRWPLKVFEPLPAP